MPHSPNKLPAPVRADLGQLIEGLESAGYTPIRSVYAPDQFGNYCVDFTGPGGSLRVVRDRSQYTVSGRRELLESAGLWRAFDDREEFASALITWFKRSAA